VDGVTAQPGALRSTALRLYTCGEGPISVLLILEIDRVAVIVVLVLTAIEEAKALFMIMLL
jgi:hypothetical protein